MNKVSGKMVPLHDKIFVSDMEFGMERTQSGIFLHSDDGKSTGIHPRWAKVWAVGPKQKDVKIGEWVCVEHGRWTRTIEYENTDGSVTEIRMVDNEAIMMTADEKPSDTMRMAPVGAGSNANFNIPGAT